MHYRVLSNIVIQQIPSKDFPYRDMTITIPWLHQYEVESTWADLTQTLKLVIPKNIKVKVISPSRPTMSGFVYLGNVNGANANLGGFTPQQVPTLLRGDRITLNVGYRANAGGKEQTYMSGMDLSKTGGEKIPDLFKGYITEVNSKLPFTLRCEDNMWLLKQMPTPVRTWGDKPIHDIISKIISDSLSLTVIKRYEQYGGVDIKVSDFSKTQLTFNVSNFITQGGSLGALLYRIKHQYRLNSYFRGDELRVGLLDYIPKDNVNHSFAFQKNIISDSLKWRRRDDVALSMTITSHYAESKDDPNSDGSVKTVNKSTQILIYYDPNKEDFTYVKREKGVKLPVENASLQGETHELVIYDKGITDPAKLFEIGRPKLQKYFYTGFRGSFETFGIPYVKHGDSVTLTDPVLPERNGTYMVKKVTYFGGAETGLRQKIEVDYLIPTI